MPKSRYVQNVDYLQRKSKRQTKVKHTRDGLNLRFWIFIALVSILIALAILYALSLALSARLCKMGFENGPNYTCIDQDECVYGESVCSQG